MPTKQPLCIKEFEGAFSVLREGVASNDFKAFCRVAYEQETAIITESFLSTETGKSGRLDQR